MMNKILIIAYACEPNTTSEPGVGWNMIMQVSNEYNVTVITRKNNSDVIEDAINSESDLCAKKNINWVFVDLPVFFQRLKKKVPMGTQIYYMFWQWKAYFVGKELHRKINFDIVHHLTFGVSWLAPPIALVRTHFIWGPIGGGDIVPPYIMERESIINRLKEKGYQLAIFISYNISPLARIARGNSQAIIFRNRSTERNFPKTNPEKRYVICETATTQISNNFTQKDTDRIKAICVGRLQYWKGFRYAVEGFHKYIDRGGDGQLTILGDGPEMKSIMKYCVKYNLEDQIRIKGRVSTAEVQNFLNSSNVMIHPSFRDGGSWAVLEGMMNGLALITVNYSGSADMVIDECGFRIQATSADELNEAIADALTQLENDTNLLRSMGNAAQQRINEQYRWTARGEAIKEIYKIILN